MTDDEFTGIFGLDFGNLGNGSGSVPNDTTGNETTGNVTVVIPTIDTTNYTAPDLCTVSEDQANI